MGYYVIPVASVHLPPFITKDSQYINQTHTIRASAFGLHIYFIIDKYYASDINHPTITEGNKWQL